ncbi:MAG: hypothetical protein AB1555_09070 [Nitrospirota bacterium]
MSHFGSNIALSGSRSLDPSALSVDPRCLLKALAGGTLPFSPSDITAGSENELQAAVEGAQDRIDFAITLQESNYWKNVAKRAAAGDSPRTLLTNLERYLRENARAVWENSWVRFPLRVLNPFALRVLQRDLVADKSNAFSPLRSDVSAFLFSREGDDWLRVPISYLLRLALAQAIADQPAWPPAVADIGRRCMDHFLNDNSSPETYSFYVVPLSPETGMGCAVARETAKRYLLTQLLVLYANERFGLARSGQRARVYFAPHPPVRQKELNALIPDAFYRELFMNPCLFGWDRGEDKRRYMHLCHQVLSRSQLNAVIKLKDAGIVTRNLVVLPSASNISLANNGTHLSLGSRLLTEALASGASPFDASHEKYLGDLTIKIVEHFLPLFVGTYSAAPYRLDFWDCHPERALGFLPHELDGAHLRMLWRRWKKKAGLTVFGRPVTPVGPLWLDRAISLLFGLRGDFVPDFRLIDYLVSLLSTDQSPALDGTPGNEQRLKRDLAQLGIFDESMSLYLLYKLRAHAVMGFSGFEGRQYSLFESLRDDLSDAASLQALLTGLAFRYIADGTVSHEDIPDTPFVESERRQFIFATAIGIPTCNVREDTANRFMLRILSNTRKTRGSRRYAGCLRVRLADYRQALVATIEADAPDLVRDFGLQDALARLRERLADPERATVAGKLTSGILREAGVASPLRLPGREFNLAAEHYYRGTLKIRHLREAFAIVADDLRRIDAAEEPYRRAIASVIGPRSAADFFASVKEALVGEELDADGLRRCLALVLLVIRRDMEEAGTLRPGSRHAEHDRAPVR